VAVAPAVVVTKREAVSASFLRQIVLKLTDVEWKPLFIIFKKTRALPYLKNKITQVRRYLYLKKIPIILNTDSL
jgi:hypothetical protein